MKCVLITGATGFVGVNLALRFAQAEVDVIGVDLTPADSSIASFLRSVETRVTFLQGDVTDRDWYQRLQGLNIDTVVHAAAVTNLEQDEVGRAREAASVNVGGTITLLNWAMDARPRRIIHASSGAIYGRRGQDLACLDETATVDPETVYAVTKSASERLALRLAALAKLDLISVRLPPQFGPMERQTSGRTRLSPLYSWCVAAVRDRELIVDRAQKARDYTYVTDVAETIYRLAVAPRLNHHVYNISSGVPVGNSEIISTLRDLVPGLRVRYVDSAGEDLTYRSPFSVRRLTDELGWSPQCNLRATLSAYLAWLKASDALLGSE